MVYMELKDKVIPAILTGFAAKSATKTILLDLVKPYNGFTNENYFHMFTSFEYPKNPKKKDSRTPGGKS